MTHSPRPATHAVRPPLSARPASRQTSLPRLSRGRIGNSLLGALVACFMVEAASSAYGQAITLAPEADIASNITAGRLNLILTGTATWNSAITINSAALGGLTIDGRGAVVTVGNGISLLPDFTQNNNSITIKNTTFVPGGSSNVYLLGFAAANVTSTLDLEGTTFNGFTNISGGKYGTIISAYGAGSNITVNGGTTGLTFSNNRGQFDSAGAVAVTFSNLTFNGKVTFESNWTGNYGGAVAVYEGTNKLTFNGNTTFKNNHSVVFGGAMDLWGGGATVQFNGPTTFDGNYVFYKDGVTADSPLHVTDQNPRGGAINIGYLAATPLASVTFASDATFKNNYVISTGANKNALGGAISVYGNGAAQNYRITFNQAGIFEGNYVYATGGTASGGAIYYDSSAAQINLGSGSRFTNNYAKTFGGAIYLQSGTINLNATTADIVFQGNRQGASFTSLNGSYTPTLGTGTPNSIYLGNSGTLNLNAGAGQKIEFHDPVASQTGTTVTVTKSGAGEAIFYGDNGATTQYNSDIRGNTTVQAGTFTLANGVAYGNTGSGVFTAQNTGTLRGGNGAELRAASLVVQTGGTLAATGGTFNLNSPSITLQAGSNLSGTGTLTASSNLTLQGLVTANIGTAQTLTVARSLVGTGGTVTKTGAGTLVLSAANTYTGATTVTGGTLQTGVTNAFASSGSVVVNTGATLNLNNYNQTAQNLSGSGAVSLGTGTLTTLNTGNTTFGGAITGTGSLAKTGSGTLTLSGASTYSGGTTISGGALTVTNGSALGVGTVSNAATLNLDFASTATLSNTLTGTGAINKTGAGTLSLTGSGSSVGTVSVGAGTLALTQNLAANTYTTTGTAATTITSNSKLTVGGAFTQGANSTLNVAVGTQNPIITANSASIGGTLNVTGLSIGGNAAKASDLASQRFTILQTNTGITGTFGTVHLGVPTNPLDYLVASGAKSADTLSYSVGLGLTWTAGPSLGNGTFTLTNATDSFEVDTVLANQTGPFASTWTGRDLTKEGAGTLILSRANTYTGKTTINGGTLQTGVTNAFANSTSVVVGTGATLALNNYSQTAQNLSGSGTITLGSGTLTAANASNTTFGGTITGGGGLSKTGAGILTLSGANTYSGGTTVSQGRLIATNGSALGTGTVTNGATLELNFSGTNNTLVNTLAGAGTVEKTGTGTLSLTGSGSSVGALTVSGGTLALTQNLAASAYTTSGTAATTITGNSKLTVGGTFTQGANSTLNVTVSGQSPIITATDAAIGGTLNITGLTLGGAPAKASELTTQSLKILETSNGITGDFSSIDFGGAASNIDYLILDGLFSNSNKDFSVGFDLAWDATAPQGTGTFTLTNATDTFEVDEVLANNTSGIFTSGWNGRDLTKNGAGTLVLSKVNTYTGATKVNGGTLQTGVANAFASSTSVSVNTGATLDMSGFSQNQIAQNLSGGGTISLGSNTLAAANTGNTTFGGTITGTGGLSKTGTGILTLSGTNTYGGNTTVSGGTLTVTNGSALGTGTVSNGATLELNFSGTSNTLSNTLTGTGTVTKTGTGTLSLTGSGSSVGTVTVTEGALALDVVGTPGNKIFAANAYTTNGGATTTIAAGSKLTVNGVFTQDAGSTLNVAVGTQNPVITAGSAAIGGTLNITGLTLPPPIKASQVAFPNFKVLQTTGGITGDFSLVDLGGVSSTLDYLVLSSGKTNSDKDYSVGFGLAWNAGSSKGNGVFTLTNTFEVDEVLVNQTGPFTTGWTGRDLTKNGAGTLILSRANTYTGKTTVNAGTLQTGVANAFASSDSVVVGTGATLDLNNYNQTAQDLSGTGTIALGSATLTAANTSDTAFTGTITGIGGKIDKTGTGILTLSGTNTYSGGTTVSGGTLTITNGSALGTGTVTNGATLNLDFASNATLSNTLTGTGAINKKGAGTLSLTGSGSDVGTVSVDAGTLTLTQSLDANTYTTQTGATTTIAADSKLSVGGTFTQAGTATLNVAVGTQNPVITATTAALNGSTLNITGLTLGTTAAKSSQLDGQRFKVLETTGGIAGNFGTVNLGGSSSPIDYLTVAGAKSADTLSYSVGFGLTWEAGSANGNGVFTLANAADTFEVDTILSNQTGPFTSGWSGQDLTKRGAGTLILSAANTYTGATIISEGTLKTGTTNAFANSSTVLVNTGATLDLNGFNQTAQNLSGGGTILLGLNTLTASNTTNNTTFGGTISGTGALTKTGTGTLTLNGTSDYSGTTTISQGRLIATNGSALGTGTATVTNGATLELNIASNNALSNTLTGAGTVTKTGAGTLSLTGSGSSVGTVTVTEGALALDVVGTPGNKIFAANTYTTNGGATTTIAAGSQLSVTGTFTQDTGATLNVALGTQSPVITANTAVIGGALNITGLNLGAAGKSSQLDGQRFKILQTTGGITGTFSPVDLGGTSSALDYLLVDGFKTNGDRDYSVGFGLTWLGGQTKGNGTFTLVNVTDSFEVDTVLANQTGPFTSTWTGQDLTKNGAGTLVLSAANTYTGKTTVNGGTLKTGIANAFAGSNSVSVNTGATLDLNNYNQIAQNLEGSGTISLGSATLTAANTSDTIFEGKISGDGSLTKTGTGILTLSGANTYTGGTTVSAGTLKVTNGSALGTGTANVVAGSTLDLNFSGTSNTLANTLTGTGTVTKTGTGILSLTGSGSDVGTVNVNAGTLALTQSLDANTYTTQAGATTAIAAGSQLSVGGVFTQQTGATLNVAVSGQGPAITANTAVIGGALNVTGLGLAAKFSDLASTTFKVLETTAGITGDFSPVDLGGASSSVDYLLLKGRKTNGDKDYSVNFDLTWLGGQTKGNGTFTLADATSFDVDTVLANQTGPFTSGWTGQDLTKEGAGTLTLSAANTYTGKTTVNGGTLKTKVANAFASSTSVSVNTDATLDLNGYDQIAQNLSGTGTIALGSATLTAANTSDTTFEGKISGDGSLTKTGTGTLTLSGANTYTGGTTVSGGTLEITNGSALGTGTANVAAGGTLDLNFADSGTLSNTLTGAGMVNKTGSGTLTLTGNNNDYTGETTISDGVLIATGSSTLGKGALIIAPSGTLSGTNQVIESGLTNRGTIDLTGPSLGNTLTVKGGMTSEGGRLIINTFLSDDTNSPTDRLILDGGSTTGQTRLIVYNAGGPGAQTEKGIKVVDAINGATTSANAFALDSASRAYRVQTFAAPSGGGSGTLAIGGYDYTLLQGGFGGDAYSWYLVSNLMARPEAGVYLGNREAGERMFTHTLQDRLNGYETRVDPITGWKTPGSAWGWVYGDTTQSTANNGKLSTQTQTTASQVGLDIAQFSSDDFGSIQLGIMGGVGGSHSKTEARNDSSYNAKGDTTGYMIGTYATWFENPDRQDGFYADTWLQHTWFDNTAKGQGLSGETYDSTLLSASLELGYSVLLDRTETSQLSLDPALQVVYKDYSSDTFEESGGTRIRQSAGDSVSTRVGARLRGRYTIENAFPVEPYLEANWWHHSRTNEIHMDRDTLSSGMPKDIGEIKLGVSGQITENLSASLGFTGQLGGNDYSQLGGMLGLRYEW